MLTNAQKLLTIIKQQTKSIEVSPRLDFFRFVLDNNCSYVGFYKDSNTNASSIEIVIDGAYIETFFITNETSDEFSNMFLELSNQVPVSVDEDSIVKDQRHEDEENMLMERVIHMLSI